MTRSAAMGNKVRVHDSRPLVGTSRVPADKSISHRAAILGALAYGQSVLRGFSRAEDCQRTLEVLAALGVQIVEDSDTYHVHGAGSEGLAQPAEPLACGRSATTMRLMAGVLASAPFGVRLTGDAQLLARPMDRIAEPLRRMGALIEWRAGHDLGIHGGPLRGIEHHPEVPSAQVKSCLLLAGLQAEGQTSVVESLPTRDHTERLLRVMGARIRRQGTGRGLAVSIQPGTLDAIELDVPGDPSSAAVLVAGAALVPGSDILLDDVCLNPTRMGFFRVLQRMGAAVELETEQQEPEPRGSIRASHRSLHATVVASEEVPAMIDELPLLALLATQAEGMTEVRGAAELRLKESDRISGVIEGLRALGAEAEELADGFVVQGPTQLRGGRCNARRDHRLALAFSLAELVTSGPVRVDGLRYTGDSFPGFAAVLEALR